MDHLSPSQLSPDELALAQLGTAADVLNHPIEIHKEGDWLAALVGHRRTDVLETIFERIPYPHRIVVGSVKIDQGQRRKAYDQSLARAATMGLTEMVETLCLGMAPPEEDAAGKGFQLACRAGHRETAIALLPYTSFHQRGELFKAMGDDREACALEAQLLTGDVSEQQRLDGLIRAAMMVDNPSLIQAMGTTNQRAAAAAEIIRKWTKPELGLTQFDGIDRWVAALVEDAPLIDLNVLVELTQGRLFERLRSLVRERQLEEDTRREPMGRKRPRA